MILIPRLRWLLLTPLLLAGPVASEPGGPLAPPPIPAPEPALRPSLQQLQAVPPPKRFDQSLDALVRQGIVTPSERRALRRGGMDLQPLDVGAFQKGCRSGALSARECRGGIALRWGLRQEGSRRPPLSVPVSALLGGRFDMAKVFRVTPRPAPVAGNGNRRLLLPILGSAFKSSGFGWRLHPLLGGWRLHAGDDLAAPEGTPVVAALAGRVVSSGLAGGYGLAVEVEHQRPRRRSLYGHLSELYVRAGDRVLQGEVLGRVGSTGLSTGPHLHFELRQPVSGGWVAVDPGEFDAGSALRGSDAVALLMGQLISSLERPSG
ncbi:MULTISPECIES: M23 family metallopeptidase [unclassified Synechococcus]|uniref:M23 family metallopeptidase n=1 Tax=unclassified Synechococcus TaxID=2626047 RepID=UPI002000F667|nr:M23 family metallopeptidase [Synechococcus sp. A10-1-5-1]UPM51468.1 M23 family metallopeptidase [Synechococcus sp. A10-1-5-1]